MWLWAVALAEVSPEDRRLVGDLVAVGVGGDGSLVNLEAQLGARWDPDGAVGPEPLGGDAWLVGRPFEGWSVQNDLETLAAAEDRGALEFDWEATATAAGARLVGRLEGASMDLELRVELATAGSVVWVEVAVTAREDLGALVVTRVVDADLDAWVEDTYAVELSFEDGAVAAWGPASGRALGLAVAGGAAGSCAFCTDADALLAGGTPSGSSEATIGVWVDLGPLATGEVARARFAYAFALDPADARALALAATTDDDHDDDGSPAPEDCDDLDPEVRPGATETQDGRDEDCDGAVDEDLDADDDGWTAADGDCDDDDREVYPGAPAGTDAEDHDCDGLPDDGSWTGEVPDDVAVEPAPGGCATAPGSAPAALLSLLALRRRRCSRS